MKRILANLSAKQLAELDKLVKKLGYSSRSQAVRAAIELLRNAESSKPTKDVFTKLRQQIAKQEKISAGEIESKILYIVEKNSKGLTLLQIAKISGLHRHTIRKYADKLIREGKLSQNRKGSKKICMPRKRGIL